MEDISLEWVISQPLGIAVLLLTVVAFATDRIVTGKAHRREQDRAALDAAADRALNHPGDLIAAALLAAVALTCLGIALGKGTR